MRLARPIRQDVGRRLREDARYLIDSRGKNGSWKDEHETKGNRVEDTCFAILFLGRATPPVKVSK